MSENKIQIVKSPIIRLPEVRSFGVSGDPGCEGLGTYNVNYPSPKGNGLVTTQS